MPGMLNTACEPSKAQRTPVAVTLASTTGMSERGRNSKSSNSIASKTAATGVPNVAAMPAAAWRLEARRGAPAGINASLVYYLPLTVIALLAVMAVTVLQRSLFVTNDSMQHYSHVWWISDQLFHHASLPLHFDLVDSGDATTFPYGFVPYLAAAVLRVPLGDWAVTLLMVTVKVTYSDDSGDGEKHSTSMQMIRTTEETM